jgi:hypothetical protein
MRFSICSAAPVFLLALLPGQGAARGQTWDLDALRAFSGLTQEQWNAVKRGEIGVRVLDTGEPTEVAIAGAARVQAATRCFTAQLEDIETFKKSPSVLRIKKLASPLDRTDLDEFSLEPGDMAKLRNCRAGDCAVKLPPGSLERLQNEVDWSRPDASAEAQSIVREQLFRYLEDYRRRGDDALPVYRDKGRPVALADEFHEVLKDSAGFAKLVPDFYQYLEDYPNRTLAGVIDFLYWSTESFGLKPVTSVTHVLIYRQPGRVTVASKQIYASHYFDASLGLTAALDDESGASRPGMYLVYLNRSRIDFLAGLWGGLRRALARGRLRDGMRKNLADTVRKLEASCAEFPKATPSAE